MCIVCITFLIFTQMKLDLLLPFEFRLLSSSIAGNRPSLAAFFSVVFRLSVSAVNSCFTYSAHSSPSSCAPGQLASKDLETA